MVVRREAGAMALGNHESICFDEGTRNCDSELQRVANALGFEHLFSHRHHQELNRAGLLATLRVGVNEVWKRVVHAVVHELNAERIDLLCDLCHNVAVDAFVLFKEIV